MIEHLENLCWNCMQDRGSSDKCVHCGFDMAEYSVKPHHLEPLTILNGRYLLGKVLGEGGFGITYSAMDLIEEKRVAIKELFISEILARKNTRTYWWRMILTDSGTIMSAKTSLHRKPDFFRK